MTILKRKVLTALESSVGSNDTVGNPYLVEIWVEIEELIESLPTRKMSTWEWFGGGWRREHIVVTSVDSGD